MNRGFVLGRFGSVPIQITGSTAVLIVLLVWIFERRIAQSTSTNGYILALAIALGLIFSVLLHELAHVVLAQKCGYRVQRITLHFFGGETSMSQVPNRAHHEFLISASGPVASAAIGLTCLAATQAVPAGDAAVVLSILGSINIILAIVNAIPALPLDGGRAMRGILWALLGNPNRATWIIARFGQVLALAMVVLIIYASQQSSLITSVDVVIVMILAGFIWFGSQGHSRTGHEHD